MSALPLIADPLSPLLFGARLTQDTAAFIGTLDDRALGAWRSLPPTSRDLAEAARHADAARFLQRRAITRSLLARRLGCEPGAVVVGHDGRGAPQLLAPVRRPGDSATFISVSGRQNFFALAFAPRRIGIDLEPVGALFDLPWNVLSAAERASLSGLAPSVRHSTFLELWTLREAGLKAQGTGFAAVEPLGRAPGSAWRGHLELAGVKIIVACLQLPG